MAVWKGGSHPREAHNRSLPAADEEEESDDDGEEACRGRPPPHLLPFLWLLQVQRNISSHNISIEKDCIENFKI